MTNKANYDQAAVTKQVRRNRLMLSAVIALPALAIDTYLPAIPQIAAGFDVKAAHAEISLSVFLVFFAIGQLVGGPLTDRRGRRITCLGGIALFALTTMLIAITFDFKLFLLLRAVQAFVGGIAIVSCFAVTRDAFSGKELSKFMSLIISVMLIAPLVAPFIGSGVLLILNWHWIFVALAIYACILFCWCWKRFSETLNPAYKPGSVSASYLRILKHREGGLLLLLSSFSMSVMFTFLTSSSSTYQGYFGVSPQQYAVLFMMNVVSIMLFTNLNIYLLRSFSMKQLMGAGVSIQFIASLGLLMLSQAETPLWLFVSLMMLAVGCMGLVLPNATSALMTFHPSDSGASNALMGLSRFAMGGTLGAIPTLFVGHGFTIMTATMTLAAATGLVCWKLLQSTRTSN